MGEREREVRERGGKCGKGDGSGGKGMGSGDVVPLSTPT